jgi:hypothetical protein
VWAKVSKMSGSLRIAKAASPSKWDKMAHLAKCTIARQRDRVARPMPTCQVHACTGSMDHGWTLRGERASVTLCCARMHV